MVKRAFGIFLILILSIPSTGADKEKKAYELIYQDVQLLRKQFLQLTKKIEKNTKDIDLIKKQLTEVLNLSRLFQKEQASFKENQKRILVQYQVLLEKLETMNLQFIKSSEDIAAVMKYSLPPTEQEGEKTEAEKAQPPEKEFRKEKNEEQSEEELQAPPPTNISPKDLYNMAYSDYLKGNYQLAIDGFKMYRDQFPKSPLTDNSLYWVGECYFSQKKFEEAIEIFNELILKYPLRDKIPAAYLKKGICLIEIGKKEEALSVFKLLISKFPIEEESKIAQQKINELVSENERYQQPQ